MTLQAPPVGAGPEKTATTGLGEPGDNYVEHQLCRTLYFSDGKAVLQ